MSVQWFPGHMHATRQALAKRMPDIDVVIELLDARLPGSSANPLLAELAQGKPALKVLNKQDLADPELTEAWLTHWCSQPATQALALDAGETAPARRLVSACRALAPLRGGMVKPLRLMICGVPNVGKSTLVNTLTGRRATKTGDEAGITKVEQRIALADDVDLFDTPGMLWPRITVQESGWNLAASGAVGRNAYDVTEVALMLLSRVRPRYVAQLQTRYRLSDIEAQSDEALLQDIGRRRGALVTGGVVNLPKAAEVVINDFRSAAWGRVSLESPKDFALWQATAAEREAVRVAKAAARNAKKIPQREGNKAHNEEADGLPAHPRADQA